MRRAWRESRCGVWTRQVFLSGFVGVTLAFAVNGGCSSSALEVVASRGGESGSLQAGAASVDNSGGTAGVPGAETINLFPGNQDSAECQIGVSIVLIGDYHLRSLATAGCLEQGDATVVQTDLSAYFTNVANPCTSASAQSWSVRPVVFESGFQLRNNAAVEYSLDVQYAGTAPGTPVILFRAHTLANQRYFFRPRMDGSVELTPAHAPAQCVTDTADGVVIWDCLPTDPRQSWQLIPDSCG